jgi:hypothetical protein
MAEPQEYFEVHNFLAQMNHRMANETGGRDRARYICEYLYHLASNPNLAHQSQRIMEAVESILKEQPLVLRPFFEYFAQDQELKEALGPYLAIVERAFEERKKDI